MPPHSAVSIDRAQEFLETHARLLERRMFARAFGGEAPGGVMDAVVAYRNPDGGFGHALEADVRASSSQPLFVHVALTSLRLAGVPGRDVGERACGFLASVSRPDGAVPYLLPDALRHPRAGHWNGDYAAAPSLLATSGIAAGLHAVGARHEWLDRATAWCLREIAGTPELSGHRLLNVLDLLHTAPRTPDRDGLLASMRARMFEADHVQMETPVRTYGVTPLHFAPAPTSPDRALFADDVIEAHLDDLAARQQADGGWPIYWSPPEGSARSEWRGRWTLEALLTLRAYGRV